MFCLDTLLTCYVWLQCFDQAQLQTPTNPRDLNSSVIVSFTSSLNPLAWLWWDLQPPELRGTRLGMGSAPLPVPSCVMAALQSSSHLAGDVPRCHTEQVWFTERLTSYVEGSEHPGVVGKQETPSTLWSPLPLSCWHSSGCDPLLQPQLGLGSAAPSSLPSSLLTQTGN